MSINFKDHWNKVYTKTAISRLGFYEEEPVPSIQLIEKCNIAKDQLILDMGSGATTLIPRLFELGYQNIVAVDISDVALEIARMRLQGRASPVQWVVDDVTDPSALLHFHNVAIWHDRAVFHFLTEGSQRQTYLSVLSSLVMPGGYVIMATFSLEGADKCSGLPVLRYSVESLQSYLGEHFNLLESMHYTFQMPSGELRPYIYGRFQKI